MIHNHSVVETEFQNQFGDSEYSKEEEMYRKLTIVLLALFGVLPACSQDKPNNPNSIDSLLSVSPEAWKKAQMPSAPIVTADPAIGLVALQLPHLS